MQGREIFVVISPLQPSDIFKTVFSVSFVECTQQHDFPNEIHIEPWCCGAE
jgi:hypothetical protein